MNETGKMSRQQECVQKLKEWRLQWEGWQEYFKFWDGFVQTWFECKENNPDALPDDSLTRCLSPLFNVQNKDVRLSKDELPEPYCIDPSQVGIGGEFDPKKIGLVIIQMNPAAAQDNLEATKYYSNKDNDEGFLIRDFENQCKKKFSEWVNRWSFFKTVYPQVGSVPPDESKVSGVSASKICGHDWWHKENRTGWFKSFAQCELNCVFALETIPYHSKNFKIENSFQDDEFKKHFLRRVLLPAGICARSSQSKVVVCCGTKLRGFLGRLKELGVASKIFTWEYEDKVGLNVEEGCRKCLEKYWPKGKNGKYKKRWYELYCCKIPYFEKEDRKECNFLILSIYANSMKFPGRDFRDGGVEKLLKERISKAMMDSSSETHSEDEVNLCASRLATATEL